MRQGEGGIMGENQTISFESLRMTVWAFGPLDQPALMSYGLAGRLRDQHPPNLLNTFALTLKP